LSFIGLINKNTHQKETTDISDFRDFAGWKKSSNAFGKR
jgi:hypothetical protein